jgi:peptidoglycan/xylan/chitin deacetylase (PgdA/CDA1 family)
MIHLRVHDYIILLILISLSFDLGAQRLVVDNSNFFYQISPIYDFKQSIISLTFDDGYITQFTVALPLLKERNIPATFYVITDRLDSVTRSLISENISQEFEIGSHTVTHADLVKTGSENAKMELLNSRSFLQRNFGLNAGLTMSYPWGIYNRSVEQVAKSIYLAARSTDVGYNSLFKFDRYALKMQNFDKRIGAYWANQWVDFAISNHLWLIEMIHGINDAGYSPIDAIVLSEHLDYINNVKDKIWCSTVSNVIKYIDESHNAEIKCDICTDSVYKLRIDDFLDDSIYNQPLTVRIKVPSNWDSISIANVENLKTDFTNENKFIQFNALPDNKVITVRPKVISEPEKESGIRIIYLSANPFHDFIKLSLDVLDQRDIDIILCDINGRLLNHQKEKNAFGVINLFFDTFGISNGVYFLRVSSDRGDLIIKKLVKI